MDIFHTNLAWCEIFPNPYLTQIRSKLIYKAFSLFFIVFFYSTICINILLSLALWLSLNHKELQTQGMPVLQLFIFLFFSFLCMRHVMFNKLWLRPCKFDGIFGTSVTKNGFSQIWDWVVLLKTTVYLIGWNLCWIRKHNSPLLRNHNANLLVWASSLVIVKPMPQVSFKILILVWRDWNSLFQ